MAKSAKAGTIRVGVGGWIFAPWRGPFYPAGLVQRRELEYASRTLGAIEINGTFYGPQSPATFARWRSETPDGFVFTLKAPRYATDRRALASAGPTIDAFVGGGLAELGDRLGPINWQLPERTAFDPDDLARFMDLLPPAVDGLPLRHALEVRHPSFADAAFVALARERKVAIVFTDSPDLPSIADPGADFIYARLRDSQERYVAAYAPSALDAWARRARAWSRGEDPAELDHVGPPSAKVVARDVFVFFIGSAKVRNPAAAVALIERLG